MFNIQLMRPIAPICESDRISNLEDFMRFDFLSTCGPCEQMDEFIDIITEDILLKELFRISHPVRYEKKLLQAKKEMRSILWNIYLCSQVDYDKYVKISLGNGSYGKSEITNPFGISRDIRILLYLMMDHGWIELKKGYYVKQSTPGKQSTFGKQTRFRPTVKTAQIIEKFPKNIKAEIRHHQQILDHSITFSGTSDKIISIPSKIKQKMKKKTKA